MLSTVAASGVFKYRISLFSEVKNISVRIILHHMFQDDSVRNMHEYLCILYYCVYYIILSMDNDNCNLKMTINLL